MKHQTKSKQPITEPKQRRSARTQESILHVVERHLLDGSYDSVTVQDIVQEANCSIGAFYGRFASKAAAMYHFYDTRCQELESKVKVILAPQREAPLFDLLAEFTSTVVYRTFSYAAIIRSDVLRISSGPDSLFLSRARDLNTALLGSLLVCLTARQSELELRPNREVALFVLAMVGGLSRDAVVNSTRLVEDRGNLTAGTFIDELTLAVTRYLGVKEPSKQTDSRNEENRKNNPLKNYSATKSSPYRAPK